MALIVPAIDGSKNRNLAWVTRPDFSSDSFALLAGISRTSLGQDIEPLVG